MKEVLTKLLEQRAEKITLHDKLEKELMAVKKEISDIDQKLVPDLLMSQGLKSIVLDNGVRITISKFYAGKVEDEKKEAFYDWLDGHGHGSIAAREITVPSSSVEQSSKIIEVLKTFEIEAAEKRSIHHKRFGSWLKEQFENEKPVPEMVNVYIGNVASYKLTQ